MQKMEAATKQNSADIDQQQLAEPRDTYKIAYIIHFLLGAGNLLPWNALITGVDYFGYLYPGRHVEKVFSVAYMGSSVLVLIVVMSFGGWSKFLSFKLRMNLGFSMFVLSLMVPPTIDWIWGDVRNSNKVYQERAYFLTVASVVICGLADGLIGGSLIGSAGKLPKQYMQAVFAGTASSGVLVCLLRIITKASLPQTPQGLRTSAHFYFIVSSTILLCCILSCALLYKLPVMQQHYKNLNNEPFYSKPKYRAVAKKIQWPAVGKALTAIYLVKSIKKAGWSCFGRLLFYPLFAACLHYGPKWLKTEVPVMVLTFMLGLTNGYLTSVVMILAPKSVPVSEAELSAIVMVVFLGFGLVGGSVLGWFWII
ncbi:equilibrative nucleotide transporter 8-like [Rutidosis leptorrhynchoides]|uniref:equilibrative nucleotide transporter 8-like n=1 Tax=Rutidosis leptorrhynchoides TaxID=125765 RepID=UPI003A998C5D